MKSLTLKNLWHFAAACIVSLPLSAAPAFAEGEALKVELNTLAETQGACRLTFLVTNDLGVDVTSLVLEAVIFTKEHQVERLTLFNFQSLPADRPRVRQFDLGGVSCDSLGSVLVNGVDTCEGMGIDAGTCQGALVPASRVAVEVLG